MSLKCNTDLQNLLNKKRKKFSLGCNVNKEEIFDYPYLTDEDTISLLKKHGRIMFIIRGPNSTMKSDLSKMIITLYKSAELCSADHYFSLTFLSPSHNRETLKQSHVYCEKKVKDACEENKSPIVIQNTHMRKWELQKYLDFAAEYNYTVIMANTLYKFIVTPEELERINPDGLNLQYFRNRLSQWQDILPLFTAWFLSPADSASISKSLQKTLPRLLNDGKFCRIFDCYEKEAVLNYFVCRRNLYYVAGFSNDFSLLKDYYLSDFVQASYGKCYFMIISGFLITQSKITAIVHINEEMTYLELRKHLNFGENICDKFSGIELNDNINKYNSLIPFSEENNTTLEENIEMQDWLENEAIDFKNCRLIHIAHKKIDPESFDIGEVQDTILKKLNSIVDESNFIEFEGIFVCRLPGNEWLVKLAQKMKVKTLFTGLYI